MAAHVDAIVALLRKDARSSTAMAEATGLHAVTIKVLRGGKKFPDGDTAETLAAAMGYEIVVRPLKKSRRKA